MVQLIQFVFRDFFIWSFSINQMPSLYYPLITITWIYLCLLFFHTEFRRTEKMYVKHSKISLNLFSQWQTFQSYCCSFKQLIFQQYTTSVYSFSKECLAINLKKLYIFFSIKKNKRHRKIVGKITKNRLIS